VVVIYAYPIMARSNKIAVSKTQELSLEIEEGAVITKSIVKINRGREQYSR
jgi:hypothetical protein